MSNTVYQTQKTVVTPSVKRATAEKAKVVKKLNDSFQSKGGKIRYF
jgi:hypothetical protein